MIRSILYLLIIHTKTVSYDVVLNEEAQEYKWVDLEDVDNYN